MQKLRVLTILLFVSITMTLGACAEDETLNEIENTIEAPYDGGDQEENDKGGMTSNGGDQEENDKGGM